MKPEDSKFMSKPGNGGEQESTYLQYHVKCHLQTCKCLRKGCIGNMRPTTQINQGTTSVYCDSFVCRQIIDNLNLIIKITNAEISAIGKHIDRKESFKLI